MTRAIERVQRRRRDLALCRFCGLAARNSAGVKVLRYPLLRHIDRGGRHTSVCIGSIAMCDACLLSYAAIKPEYRT